MISFMHGKDNVDPHGATIYNPDHPNNKTFMKPYNVSWNTERLSENWDTEWSKSPVSEWRVHEWRGGEWHVPSCVRACVRVFLFLDLQSILGTVVVVVLMLVFCCLLVEYAVLCIGAS